jgi:hypothetical protein
MTTSFHHAPRPRIADCQITSTLNRTARRSTSDEHLPNARLARPAFVDVPDPTPQMAGHIPIAHRLDQPCLLFAPNLILAQNGILSIHWRDGF